MKRTPYFLIASIVMLLISCGDFLEERQRGALIEDHAFETMADLKNHAVLSLYNYIGGNSDSQGLQGTGRGVYDLNTMTTDEAIVPTRGGDWYDGGFWQDLFLHNWGTSNTALENTWDYLFKVVMLCNKSLKLVKTFHTTHNLTNDETHVLETYAAEIRAVRAMFYFYLMDLYGRVPIVTTSDTVAAELTLADRSKVFQFVVKELQEALPHLSWSKSNMLGENYGRITIPVANFLLAKLMLNAEIYSDDNWTDKNYPDGKSMTFIVEEREMNAWEACLFYCERIQDFEYSLEESFSYNFSPTNENSKENIFTIPMDPNLYSNRYIYFFRSRNCCHGAALGGGSENGPCATIEALRAFKYGTPEKDYRFSLTFYADTIYENGNLVMMDDGVTPLVYYPWEVKLNLTGSPYVELAGARIHKYAPDPNANADGRACHNDIVLFRYADVLLMMSEAKVRNGEDGTAELNMVRSRVMMPDTVATLETILNERELELAWEGWRRNDLIRFRQYTRPYTDRPQVSNEENGFTTVFPIPSSLIDFHPTWKQNPGYY